MTQRRWCSKPLRGPWTASGISRGPESGPVAVDHPGVPEKHPRHDDVSHADGPIQVVGTDMPIGLPDTGTPVPTG
jgi:hypothetical protein